MLNHVKYAHVYENRQQIESQDLYFSYFIKKHSMYIEVMHEPVILTTMAKPFDTHQ